MAAKRIPRTPKYRHHRPSGQAFVEIDERRIYLGKYDTPESRQKYARILGEWASNGYRLPVKPEQITMLELTDRYWEHAKVYYRDPTGQQTSSLFRVKTAIDTALTMYRDTPAVQFGPNALRAVRQVWIDRGIGISTINGYTSAMKLMFKWACSHELVPVHTHAALMTVSGLRRGRGQGKDPQLRVPANLEDVEAVIPHLPRQLAAIVRLLLLTGARPSEVLNLKRGDIDVIEGGVWAAKVDHHKLSYMGKQRRIFFGPKAQAVLRPFMLRKDNEFLFSPIEAYREWLQEQCNSQECKDKPRRPNQKDNPRKTDRTLGECYLSTSLNRAIRRVCDEHGITPWTPYQLRHLAATTIEASADLETASAILGHSGLNITQVYVHRDNRTAAAWAAAHG